MLLAAAPAAVRASDERPIFADRAPELGVGFVHTNGMTGQYYFPEMTGQGGALVDYDGDGDLDLYLVQGGLLGPADTLADLLVPPPEGTELTDRLYRNDAGPGPGGALEPRFVDATAASGLDAGGYGMGVAVGDVDGDGFPDLYLTNYGPNELWLANGDGTFRRATAEAGVEDASWSTSAAFLDYDGDGHLDLYVVNYVRFDVAENPRCYATSSRRDYCGPSSFEPLPDRLFRNLGDGRFEETTSRALPGYRPGPGLGVVAADFDGDRRPDLYVANDGAANQLWLNRGDGTFVEDALLAGVAVNREGRAEASMGVDAGDVDLDGDEDLFMTHLMDETNTLYVNDGNGLFEDRTVESGLAAVSLPYTSFGTGWVDVDNDGLPDLVVLNGAVRVLEPQAAAGDPYPLRQPNQLFRNRGGTFEEITARAGGAFAVPEVSRGAAFGDLDNDGDTDLLVLNNNGPARLLVNLAGQETPWLGLRAASARSAASGVGVRLGAVRSDTRVVWRRARTDGSYCSANDPRVIAGLGEAERWEAVRAEWPGGAVALLRRPPANRYLSLYRPASKAVDR